MEYTEDELEKSPILSEQVLSDTPLKELILQYVGEKHNPEDGLVTVEMIVDVMAAEFPQFVMALAEENFIRGYEQAAKDFEDFDNKSEQHLFNNVLSLVEKNES
jgi:hypothetical protein